MWRKTFHKIFCSIRNFLELQCLVDDLVDFLELLCINAYIQYIIWWSGYGTWTWKTKKFLIYHLNGINILFYLKNLYQWLKLITCSYTSREYTVEKKMTYAWKRWLTAISKFHIFIASKGVGLSSNIWCSRKALKGLLQNIYLSQNYYIINITPLWRLLYIKALSLKKHLRL